MKRCPIGLNRLMAMSGESRIIDNAELWLPEQDLIYNSLTSHKVSRCVYQRASPATATS